MNYLTEFYLYIGIILIVYMFCEMIFKFFLKVNKK